MPPTCALRTGVWLLRFVALYSFFDAMGVVFGHAVRGAGDTRFSFVFIFISAWSIMVMPTLIAQATVGGSLAVAWWSCTSYIMVIGVGFVLRFQTGKWKLMRVIEDKFHDPTIKPEAAPVSNLVAVRPDEE
jgi:MATE family multidrug resistance protein